MIHAREDYQRIQDPANKIPADEPVFLLRAQDALACKAVAFYALLCEAAQAPDIAARARLHSNKMAAWPVKKTPDLPEHLRAAEMSQFEGDGLDEVAWLARLEAMPPRPLKSWGQKRAPDAAVQPRPSPHEVITLRTYESSPTPSVQSLEDRVDAAIAEMGLDQFAGAALNRDVLRDLCRRVIAKEAKP